MKHAKRKKIFPKKVLNFKNKKYKNFSYLGKTLSTIIRSKKFFCLIAHNCAFQSILNVFRIGR